MSLGTFSAKCPHCGTRSVAFNVLNCIPEHPSHYRKDIFSVCQRCKRGVSGEASVDYNNDGKPYGFHDVKFFSFQFRALALEHIPEDVEVNFREGEANIWDGRYNSAGMIFRKALEMGMKIKFPKFEGSLKGRIDRAKEKGHLTKDMADWAHNIRSFGNDAAHEPDFSEEDAEEMQTFTRLVLLYLFTLPGMMKVAREKKESDPENSEPTASDEE